MSDRDKTPAAQDKEESEPGVDGQPEADGQMEAAPTDFRRNLWILIIILAVVAAAWVVNRIVGTEPEGDAEPPPPPAPAETSTPQEPARQPPSYAELVDAQRRAGRLAVHSVIAGKRRYIVASPAHISPGAEQAVPPRLFDVTRTAEGFDLEDLVHQPGAYAGRFPVLGQSSDDPAQFAPAKDVGFLAPHERVIVVSEGEDARAYPVRILNIHSAIRDELAGTPILVCWSFVTQMPRCFVIPEQDAGGDWGASAKFYRGNPVLYDTATGSLWDTFSGLALTGPKAGTRLSRLPATVHPWGEWQKRRPESRTLSTDTDHSQEVADGVASYLDDPGRRFPVPGYDPETSGGPPPKAFVIGVEAGGQARAYPLLSLLEARGNALEDELGGQKLTITVTSLRTAQATDAEGRLLDAPVMLWFGWKAAHPDTELWSPSAD